MLSNLRAAERRLKKEEAREEIMVIDETGLRPQRTPLQAGTQQGWAMLPSLKGRVPVGVNLESSRLRVWKHSFSPVYYLKNTDTRGKKNPTS